MHTSNQSKLMKAWIGVWISGISGSGKTTVGNLLARELRCGIRNSDDDRYRQYIVGRTPQETADIMAAEAGAIFSVWTSLTFPAREGFLKVGLFCPARIAMSRKPSGYSAWLEGGLGGQTLDRWPGLEGAHVVLDGTRTVSQIVAAIKEQL